MPVPLCPSMFDRNVTKRCRGVANHDYTRVARGRFGGSRHVIDGVGVFCVDTAPAASARPTVVAVHGIPESSVAWRDVAAVVGDSARMVIPDLPGFGRSDKPPKYDYSLARQSRLLEALLERVVPKAPIHLAVHDIGGPVGLMWAIRNPDRLASLLILNTTLFLELFRPPVPALISLVPVVGPRASPRLCRARAISSACSCDHAHDRSIPPRSTSCMTRTASPTLAAPPH